MVHHAEIDQAIWQKRTCDQADHRPAGPNVCKEPRWLDNISPFCLGVPHYYRASYIWIVILCVDLRMRGLTMCGV
jgi:hypothetical protein